MNTDQPIWATTEEAAAALQMGKSTLWALHRGGELTAGQDWIYLTGKPKSPVGWSIPALKQWQIEKTKRITKARKQATAIKAAEVESFDEPDSVTPTDEETFVSPLPARSI